jgi:hypothetical protein
VQKTRFDRFIGPEIGDTFLTYVSPVIFVTVGENMLSGRNPSWEYETRREKHSGA